MLDSDTKRRIDSCRDILVGKVPNPQSQVEQITIAMIYKFMDDMDAEAEEFGGARKFFAGEFAKYSWPKLMAPDMGGFDVLALYSEAIQKMNENPGIPPLFRDIFKNAYLPYRDPETLRIFLKEINWFTYDHSERLGDAFEYLLSVLGSQGDAGQFRTPRNIIDFMVEIIDPKKNETILDTACGTSGFLISSYKHILKHNSTDYSPKKDHEAYDEKGVSLDSITIDSPLHYKGDLLTPDDRKKLSTNIFGYDISPDMVRLSLVNMYLHGFTHPNIIEYDTLTSDERWNEYADIILANPPFMSPKGGIKPHKRFSVQAKRSEVLFVDYIAEHLTPSGRAAIIVPEGIIFQNGTAYKQLRKMLVDSYLVAVISLPTGVFNPYSGVKTSILILDRRLSKKTENILFAKIENDGFNLGAQRRAIDKNDLPAAAKNIKAYLDDLRNDGDFDLENINNLHLVEKSRIAENGEWNLSGDRYHKNAQRDTTWPLVELSSICDVRDGTHDSPKYKQQGYPLITSRNLKNGVIDFEGANLISKDDLDAINKRSKVDDGDILMPMIGTIGNPVIAIVDREFAVKNVALIKFYDESKIDRNFLKAILSSSFYQDSFDRNASGSTQKFISLGLIRKLLIPLPPIDVQKEIVAEIEDYQKIIDGARQVLKNYRPIIQANPDWPIVRLGEVCSYSGGTQPPKDTFITEPREGYIRLLQIRDYKSDANAVYIPKEARHKTCEPEDVMIGRYGPPVFQILKGKSGAYNVALIKCLPDLSRLDRKWLFHFLNSPKIQDTIIALSDRVRQSGVRPDDLDELKIPLPDLDTQRSIIAKIEEEQRLVNNNKELIDIFEIKVKASINRVLGEAK